VAGDEGADISAGDFLGGPVIWQCKTLASDIGNSQKQQIRASDPQLKALVSASRVLVDAGLKDSSFVDIR
jgi:hypothetical protein